MSRGRNFVSTLALAVVGAGAGVTGGVCMDRFAGNWLEPEGRAIDNAPLEVQREKFQKQKNGVRRDVALNYAIVGALLGSSICAASSIGRLNVLRIIAALAVGALSGAVGGAAGGLAADRTFDHFFWERHNASTMAASIAVALSLWGSIALFIGLGAAATGLGVRRLPGAVLGGILAGCMVPTIGSLAFPIQYKSDPLPPFRDQRLLSTTLSGALIGFGFGAAAGRRQAVPEG